MTGLVYLLHLRPAYRHARHYVGYVSSARALPARLEAHASGRGARLLQVVCAYGGRFELVATARGSRRVERAVKVRRNVPRLCPECRHDGGRAWVRTLSRLNLED